MSFLSKLFGGGQAPQAFDLEPTAEMMDEGRYWGLISDSLAAAGEDQDAQLAFLKRELAKLSPKKIVGFRLRTDKLLYDTYNPTMWCAGYIMNGGCSDDMFEYFRLWVISRGRSLRKRQNRSRLAHSRRRRGRSRSDLRIRIDLACRPNDAFNL